MSILTGKFRIDCVVKNEMTSKMFSNSKITHIFLRGTQYLNFYHSKMKFQRSFFLAIFLSHVILVNAQSEEDYIQLFNGKNLEGWTVKIRGYEVGDNFGNTFRVKDGNLQVGYEAYDKFDERFGHIFYKDPYSYYILEATYRFVGEQASEGPGWAFKNSGLMLHSPAASAMGKDQDFPISIEVQLLGGRETGDRTTANLCTPGTNVVMNGKLTTAHCINSTSPTFRGEEWVTAKILVLGDSLIRHYVNDEPVLEYTHPQIGGGSVSGHDTVYEVEGQLLTGGYISLQSESHPIEYQSVRLLNLVGCMDPKASNFKDYYVKADNSSCKY